MFRFHINLGARWLNKSIFFSARLSYLFSYMFLNAGAKLEPKWLRKRSVLHPRTPLQRLLGAGSILNDFASIWVPTLFVFSVNFDIVRGICVVCSKLAPPQNYMPDFVYFVAHLLHIELPLYSPGAGAEVEKWAWPCGYLLRTFTFLHVL